MQNTYKILCPIDYSKSSEPAISLASKLATGQPSKVILLHIVEQGGDSSMSLEQAQSSQIRERLCDQYFNERGIDHEFETFPGNAASAIAEFARKKAVDVIVMGTHGRSGLARVVQGSVAQSVMNNAHCPVISIKLPDKT